MASADDTTLLISDGEAEPSPSVSMTISESVMYAAVIHCLSLDVYASRIYSRRMEPEDAKQYFGALALAVADSIASASASLSLSGPGTALMVLLSFEPGLPISALASRIRLSHAGTVRLIDRLESDHLVERRRQTADKRARFIHLTNSGEKMIGALLDARERVIAAYVSPLSPTDLDDLGTLSGRLLYANGLDKSRLATLWHLGGYQRRRASGSETQPARRPRRRPSMND